MTRVIHTADTHIGYRQYHSPERRRDFLAAFEAVVADAVADGVDAVVHAGDLFHDRRPDLADVLGTVGALRELREADIPFLAVVGNHEGTRDAQWLDLFESMGLATRLGRDGERVGDTVFYGLDYVPQSRRDGLDYEFQQRDAEHAALVAHGLFAPLAAYADWDIETVLAASPVEFDAVLLGDDHQPDRTEVDGTWLTYPGSTERASASERDERGYNIVTFDDGVRITRRGLDTRRFVFLDLDLEEGEGTEFVRRRLREFDLDSAVAVVTVEGDGEEVIAADVEAAGAAAGALITRVNDRRERATGDRETEVTFADPDEAVDDRIESLGLGPAALAADATVRDPDVADSNVRERVRTAVRERLEEDPATLAAPDTDDATSADEDGAGDAADADPDPAEATEETDDSGDDTGDGGDPDADDGDASAETTAVTGETDDGKTADAGDGDGAAEGTAGRADSQSTTIEDYL